MAFNRNLLLFSLAFLGIVWTFNGLVPEKFVSPHAYYIVAYFFIQTLVIHRLALQAETRSPQAFVRFFIGSTAFRLFLHLTVLLAYGLINRPGAVTFIMGFLVIYFAYLIFEVTALSKHFRKK